jgi:hypothetical protein
MSPSALDHDPAMPSYPPADGALPGAPWSFRLAGVLSARPAVELYEAGDLLDVVSSTPVAPQLVRGARATSESGCQRALAWGRLPATGGWLAVEFSSGTVRRYAHRAAVIEITGWCWLAVADGRFDRVVVSSGGRRLQQRVTGGRRWR